MSWVLAVIEEGKGRNCAFEEEPIAFGLKALIVSFDIDEEQDLEPVEEGLRNAFPKKSEESVRECAKDLKYNMKGILDKAKAFPRVEEIDPPASASKYWKSRCVPPLSREYSLSFLSFQS